VALSEDGKHILTGSADNQVVFWDAATAKKTQTIEGHAAPITGLTLSDDGKRLWTTSEDGTVRLWDMAAGKELCRLHALDADKNWLVLTPDGRFDGSEGAWKYLAYREPGGLKLHDDEATRKKFHRPGLLAEVWKGVK
jgi:WD40 repeat protein